MKEKYLIMDTEKDLNLYQIRYNDNLINNYLDNLINNYSTERKMTITITYEKELVKELYYLNLGDELVDYKVLEQINENTSKVEVTLKDYPVLYHIISGDDEIKLEDNLNLFDMLSKWINSEYGLNSFKDKNMYDKMKKISNSDLELLYFIYDPIIDEKDKEQLINNFFSIIEFEKINNYNLDELTNQLHYADIDDIQIYKLLNRAIKNKKVIEKLSNKNFSYLTQEENSNSLKLYFHKLKRN